ncbi:SpoIIE family protein phosphatase [Streptomyces sp. TRM S81-3]|uniref:SpoIIE family protein phosphatase n=1 Tax=Streptomyces griseicoloratus TaxID=2752516 RepID=A0A926L102_9ACTN|nr:SpoIIE family protein phosphatase [Streptomyces griseicoloratus]MBD0418536.1 SpoIIE family protein phosphatase [Streptomyces griseicoloratus]
MEHASAAAIVDAHGTVTGWSEGARRLTGHPAEEVVGRDVRELLAEDVPPGALSALAGTAVVRHRDGTAVTLYLRACPLLGADGAPTAYAVSAGPPVEPELVLTGEVFEQASLSMSVLDAGLHYVRVNDTACRTAGVPARDLIGRYLPDTLENIDDDVPAFLGHLRQVAETGRPVQYESFTHAPSGTRQHAWTVEMWPVRDAHGRVAAVAMAALESTEQHRARERLALLNSAAAIGTTLDVVRTAEELVEILVPRFADFATVDLLDWVLGTDEPLSVPTEDIELRRVAHAFATEGFPTAPLPLGGTDVYPPCAAPARALREGRVVISGPGDPEFAQWMRIRDVQAPHNRRYREAICSMLAVPLRARGTTLGVAVADRIRPQAPYAADDAVLAEELVGRAAVSIDNARRFARERGTALELQHSLLPRGLPGQSAVEVAHRYLPSGSAAGIGGDWFDVIPLSGSRVALVVGDVVGHGIPSTATMGRLCTAVRTLADVDLPPDELLTHLDDLVTHLAGDESGDEIAELGATCLYAVYDPVTRRLDLAAAGHPAPALLLPDGTTRLVPMTAGPPLGVGGLPFEATRMHLPEGSVVALYTDGLVEDRDGDVDHATTELRRALTAPAASLDALCDVVLKAVMPEEPSDDVVLLLGRTRVLGADQVATWDVLPDTAEVATTRQSAVEQLTAWGLSEEAFVTELVVSELVTNAIRYGGPPIQLRLIRDRTLICEVSDGSSTSPHLRRAHAFDEGGRGLLLVAQLTQRWGTRQTGCGKTIWAEQPLPSR